MDLITPDFGLFFWMVLTFALVLFILKKFAWKTIVFTLKEREKTIEDGISNAARIKEEMVTIHNQAEKILQEARMERDKLIKQGRELKERIVSEAREQAAEEVQSMMANAADKIEEQRLHAINQMKIEITNLSVKIAEKILRRKMEDKNVQKEIVTDFLGNLKNN
jgi:F-type H+-transporting ATPase subunit b